MAFKRNLLVVVVQGALMTLPGTSLKVSDSRPS